MQRFAVRRSRRATFTRLTAIAMLGGCAGITPRASDEAATTRPAHESCGHYVARAHAALAKATNSASELAAAHAEHAAAMHAYHHCIATRGS